MATKRLIVKGHKITWWAVAEGQRFPSTSSLRGTWSWDATCECGFDTRTGGAVESYVAEKVRDHKVEMIETHNEGTTLWIPCQNEGCGRIHEATFSHVSPFGNEAIYEVVCTDGLSDFYTAETAVPKPKHHRS